MLTIRCGVAFLLILSFAKLNSARTIEKGWEDIFGDSPSTTLPIHVFGNKSYLLVTDYKMTFLQAMDFCENMHMNLVTIESEAEQKILQNLIASGNSAYWTAGARILDGKTWLWLTTGDIIGYSAWAPGEPTGKDESCLTIQTKSDLKSWNDLSCDHEQPFICERPIDEKRVDLFAEEEKDWQNVLNVHQRSINLDLLHFNGKDYYISHDYKGSFSEALDYCQFLNMKLATIDSKEESDRLYRHIRDISAGTEFWTSGTNLLNGQNWIWLTNNQPISYTNWGLGQPDIAEEHCLSVRLEKNTGLFWNNAHCVTPMKAICERKKDNTAEEFESNLKKIPAGQIQTVVQDGRKFHVSRNLLANASEARIFCSYHNMALLNIKNAEESAIIAKLLPYPVGDESFWTDGEKLDGKWVWKSSDTPITYFNWRQGSPQGESCLGLSDYAKYQDVSCDERRPFICEDVNDETITKKDNGDAIINVLMENNLITKDGKVTTAKELVSSQYIEVNPNGGYHITVDNSAVKC